MADHSDREQRTEEATPRRREEARERGQVALSSEFVAAVGLAAGTGILFFGGAPLGAAVGGEIERVAAGLAGMASIDLDVQTSSAWLTGSLQAVAGALAAVVVPTVLVSALTGYAQVGFRFAGKALELDPEKLSPTKGLQRMFSLRGLVRAALSALKTFLIAGVAALVAWMHVDEIVAASTSDLGPMLVVAGTIALRTVVATLAVVLFLAVLDALFQRLQHERDLRMTRAEVREEQRLTEGDPHVRARIRAVQREFAMRRMMEDVPKATVVVTNPTHYAVALRYERAAHAGSPGAPVVVAKGVDHLAQRIKELARQNGVPCHEDVPLARALHARARIGQEIPEELYSAVAAVLATVYRLEETRLA